MKRSIINRYALYPAMPHLVEQAVAGSPRQPVRFAVPAKNGSADFNELGSRIAWVVLAGQGLADPPPRCQFQRTVAERKAQKRPGALAGHALEIGRLHSGSWRRFRTVDDAAADT